MKLAALDFLRCIRCSNSVALQPGYATAGDGNEVITGTRPRPCLEYDIKRCIAPCVAELCNEEQYSEAVRLVRIFLRNDRETLREVIRLEIDTSHFKGNYPESCSVDGGVCSDGDLTRIEWSELLPMTKLQAHTDHTFADRVRDIGEVTHVRLNIFPDGGVSRLRVHGRIA